MLVNTKALVLKSIPFKESDLIVTLFTQKFGKINVLVKGAKKMKSKLSYSVQMFTFGDYLLYKKNNNLPILRQGDVDLTFKNHSFDLGVLSAAYYICEFVNFFMLENEHNQKLFRLTEKTMRMLTTHKEKSKTILATFKIKAMALMGYSPYLTGCVLCGEKNENYIFSVPQGGLVCESCLPYKNKFISKRHRLLMLFVLRTTFEEILNTEVKDSEVKYLNKVLNKYIQFYSDGHIFKSEQIFQKL
ncbi:DNA repair protein RecO [Proteinivorax hydrogeniformans]|uniref:DNA repair protein RecO n=1 Tax=Proteinivorax hydrogeniformans TaxID=1826727 RepID=A0AAU8HWP4_9FIRM